MIYLPLGMGEKLLNVEIPTAKCHLCKTAQLEDVKNVIMYNCKYTLNFIEQGSFQKETRELNTGRK